MHPIRVVRSLYYLFVLTTGSCLGLRWIGGRTGEWSGRLGSIWRQDVSWLVNRAVRCRCLGHVCDCEWCLLLLLILSTIDVAGLGKGSWRILSLHRALAALIWLSRYRFVLLGQGQRLWWLSRIDSGTIRQDRWRYVRSIGTCELSRIFHS